MLNKITARPIIALYICTLRFFLQNLPQNFFLPVNHCIRTVF